MNIIFMGTPEFAVPSLKKILEGKHNVSAVVTAPDKERGRGQQLSFTPVKEFALKNNLQVYNPINLRDESFVALLKELTPDLFVVVAFRILPKEVYTIPKYGSFNLHGSLLPKYRGAAPIQWALINGENETGVTTFFLEEKVDTGNIILQEKIIINKEDDFGSLHNKMMMIGSDVVMKTIEQIDSNSITLIRQNDNLTSQAPKITKEICEINFNDDAVQIHNLVRGLSPYPCAFFTHNRKSYKVYKTNLISNNEIFIKNSLINSPFKLNNTHLPVKVFQTKTEIFIQTGNGILQILELQPDGRKRMTAEEFLRGNSLIK